MKPLSDLLIFTDQRLYPSEQKLLIFGATAVMFVPIKRIMTGPVSLDERQTTLVIAYNQLARPRSACLSQPLGDFSVTVMCWK
jgi:hypothetical protein